MSRARRGLTTRATAILAVAAIVGLMCMRSAIGQPVDKTRAPPRALKVLTVLMFEPEAAPWIAPLRLGESVLIAGLLHESPALRCNAGDVCLLVTGMGHANAAGSTLAVALDPRLDLTRTYFLVAGIAGIDPAQGTLGAAT